MFSQTRRTARQPRQLREAVSGDLTGLEGRARRLVERLATDAQLVTAAYADFALTRTNHVARRKRLCSQLDAAVNALDASAAHRKVQ